MEWNLKFISEEDFTEHVRATIEKKGIINKNPILNIKRTILNDICLESFFFVFICFSFMIYILLLLCIKTSTNNSSAKRK